MRISLVKAHSVNIMRLDLERPKLNLDGTSYADAFSKLNNRSYENLTKTTVNTFIISGSKNTLTKLDSHCERISRIIHQVQGVRNIKFENVSGSCTLPMRRHIIRDIYFTSCSYLTFHIKEVAGCQSNSNYGVYIYNTTFDDLSTYRSKCIAHFES